MLASACHNAGSWRSQTASPAERGEETLNAPVVEKTQGVLVAEFGTGDRETIWPVVKVNACADFAFARACSADQKEREKKGEEAKRNSVKLGGEPKATKVAPHPESLSPAEDTRTVVLFNRTVFPLAPRLH